MLKKFLALMAVIGMLSTSSAFALGSNPLPGDGGSATAYITNLAVTPSTLNLLKGETATVSFDLAQAAPSLYAYAINSNYEIVAVFANKVGAPAGHVQYTWLGKVGNVASGTNLADGAYTVKLVAYDTTNSIVDIQSKDVTIASVNENAPVVSKLVADPMTFSAAGNEDSEISFEVSKDAYVAVTVKKNGTLVKSFSDYDGTDWYKSTERHSIDWDGTDNNDNLLADGTYQVYVVATNDSGSNNAFISVEIKTSGAASDGVISDVTLEPNRDWDPTDEELSIDFELTSDVKSLTIEAKQGNNVVEIVDNDYADSDDYTETWDGTDDDGDYVDAGTWYITVRADGNKVTKAIEITYPTPEIADAFVTKTSFDPSLNEFTDLAFKLTAAANVTVDVYKGSKKEFTLVDGESVRKNRWYSVTWNGYDEDGDEVEMGKDWKFKITAENPTEDDTFDTAIVEVDVEEDEVSDKKANVTNDYTSTYDASPVVLGDNGSMTFAYTLDENAEVYLAVYEGKSTSGKAEIELLDYVSQDVGYHSVEWNGLDSKGKRLKDGVYSFKIISKSDASQKDTETGLFAVGDSDTIGYNPEPNPDPNPNPNPNPEPNPPVDGTCGAYYWDLSSLADDNELCTAIAWATEQGIFSGRPDGSFGAHDYINRAETLKVVLEAFDIAIVTPNGSKEGFNDVDPWAWYMPYVKTAKNLGILDGYNNGTEARLTNTVNRVELLKFVLEASSQFTGYEFSTGYYYPTYDNNMYGDVGYNADQYWFYDYANAAFSYQLYNTQTVNGVEYLNPAQLVERGEVALLLYRMEKAGLLK